MASPVVRKTKDKALEGTTFSDTVPAEHLELKLNVRGAEKVGKTYLALSTAPEPIAYQNGDRDNSRLLRWLMKQGRRIMPADPYYYTLPGPKQITTKMDANAARAIYQKNSDVVTPLWQRWVKEHKAALESKTIRTVVVDTGTWVYQTIRLARYGTVSPPKWTAQEYKAEMESILHWADDYGKLVIWIHRTAPVWEDFVNEQGEKDSRTTGEMRTEGFDRTDYIMDATVELEFDLEAGGVRKGKVVSAIRGTGKVLEGDKLTIPDVCALVTKMPVDKWA